MFRVTCLFKTCLSIYSINARFIDQLWEKARIKKTPVLQLDTLEESNRVNVSTCVGHFQQLRTGLHGSRWFTTLFF